MSVPGTAEASAQRVPGRLIARTRRQARTAIPNAERLRMSPTSLRRTDRIPASGGGQGCNRRADFAELLIDCEEDRTLRAVFDVPGSPDCLRDGK